MQRLNVFAFQPIHHQKMILWRNETAISSAYDAHKRDVRDAIGGNSFIAADDIGGSQNVQAATEAFRWPSSTLQVPQGIV